MALTLATKADQATTTTASAPTLGMNGMRHTAQGAARERHRQHRTEPEPVAQRTGDGRDEPADQRGHAGDEADRARQPAPLPDQALDEQRQERMAIWRAKNARPNTRKRRRTAGSARTPRTAPYASERTDPFGTTSGRTSVEPNASRSATPTESAAESQIDAGDRPF